MWRLISAILIVLLVGGGIFAEITIDNLQGEIAQTQELLDLYNEVPQGYYSNDTSQHRPNTYIGLYQFLDSGVVLPQDYEAEVFDCSESAAYLEWALEYVGFNAVIVCGLNPRAPEDGSYHAWVIVYTEDSYKVAIEATAQNKGDKPSGIVYTGDPNGENYHNGYEYCFENIYQCASEYMSISEWNWWEGIVK